MGNDDAFQQSRSRLETMIRRGKSWSGNERNCCFLNTGGERFATISSTAGFDYLDDGRAVATVDWDQDGDLDVWLVNRTAPQVRFLENRTAAGSRFLAVRLKGKTANRDAVGARVELYPAGQMDRPMVRSVRAGESFLSQSTKWLHFGLGDDADVEKLVVRWPGGGVQEFTDVKANRRLIVEQGAGTLAEFTTERVKIAFDTAAVPTVEPTEQARVRLSPRVPAPHLAYTTREGRTKQVRDHDGPVLVTLWASWCAPCVAELAEFTARAEELRNAGLDVVAVSADGLKNAGNPNCADGACETPAGSALVDAAAVPYDGRPRPSTVSQRSDGRRRPSYGEAAAVTRDSGVADANAESVESAWAMLDRLKFPFSSGLADGTFAEKLKLLRGLLFQNEKHFPIPTSFLIDADGRLAVIYRGRVDVDHVLDDVRLLEGTEAELRDRSVPFAGRWFTKPRQASLLKVADGFRTAGYERDASLFNNNATWERATALCREGATLAERGRFDLAMRRFRESVAVEPDFALARVNLGVALLKTGGRPEGRRHLERAVEVEPDLAFARFCLGTFLMQSGDAATAVSHFRAVLETEPHDVNARYNLAVSLAQVKLHRAAVKELRTLLEEQPDHLQAKRHLAWILATSREDDVREPERAVRLAEQVSAATGRRVPAVEDTRAAAYAAVGRFEEAVQTATNAEQTARSTRQAPLAAAIAARLQLYQAGKPYHE